MLSALEYDQAIRDAAKHKDVNKVKYLILALDFDLESFNSAIWKIITFASADDEWDIIAFLLHPEILPYIDNRSLGLQFLLCEAIVKQKIDIINRILQPDCIGKGLDLMADDNYAFKCAVYTNNVVIVERLLQPDCIALGVDPTFNNNNDLQEMLEHGYFQDVAKILLQQPRVQATLTTEQRRLADKFLK